MSQEDIQEMLTVCAEFALTLPRSDAQGLIEAMSPEKREEVAHAIRQLLAPAENIPGVDAQVITLKRDGEIIDTYKTENELFFAWSRACKPYTLWWAVKHEGYTVEIDGEDISSKYKW